MGTNYYWISGKKEKKTCPTCEQEVEYEPRVHIGKSSGGWCFALHVYPTVNEDEAEPIYWRDFDSDLPPEPVHDLEDWKRLWETPGSWIRNEYGQDVSVHGMLKCITERSRDEPLTEESVRAMPLGGGAGLEEFLKRNYAMLGPNNLLRHDPALDRYCIGHGEGTWDLITGDFS